MLRYLNFELVLHETIRFISKTSTLKLCYNHSKEMIIIIPFSLWMKVYPTYDDDNNDTNISNQ